MSTARGSGRSVDMNFRQDWSQFSNHSPGHARDSVCHSGPLWGSYKPLVKRTICIAMERLSLRLLSALLFPYRDFSRLIEVIVSTVYTTVSKVVRATPGLHCLAVLHDKSQSCDQSSKV